MHEGIAYIPSDDRGLAYGDGVWETLAVKQGQTLLLDAHWRRLAWGLEVLNIQGCDLIDLKQKVVASCHTIERGVLKVIVTRGSSQRGYNPNGLFQPRTVIQMSAAPDYSTAWAEQGIVLGLCTRTRLAHQPLLAGFKHLNRLEQVLARAEFQADWQEALILDYSGNVIEGTFSNVFVYHNQCLITPNLHQCGIEGIMRGQVLKMAQQLGMITQIRAISLTELTEADSLWLSNSLMGLFPVQRFQQKTYGVADTMRRLQQQLKPYHL